MALNIPPVHVLMRLRQEALAGSARSKKELEKLNKQMARESNRRLSRLEKSGFTVYAYEGAIGFTQSAYGTNRYAESGISIEDAYVQALSMRKFLGKDTSTVKGQRDVEKRRIAQFRQTMELTKNRASKDYMTNAQISDFLRFLGEKPIRNLLSNTYRAGSEELVEDIRGQYTRNPSARKEILKLVDEYLKTEKSGELIPKKERLYYPELVQYLKTGKLPDGVELKRGKITRRMEDE